EGLTDRPTADAVRTRIDWKYLLCLELDDRGFHHTVLSEFRTRLLEQGAESRLFETILAWAREHDLLQPGGRQRTDSTHVIGAVRMLTRIDVVTESLRHALLSLASEAPDWLRTQISPTWVERYEARAGEFRLPKSKAKRMAWVNQVGMDGIELLSAIYTDTTPSALRALPAVEILRQVWVQNYIWHDGRLAYRDNDNLPPAGRYISSPYDTDVRYANKRTTAWTGYKVHLTETCDEERPNLITNVETTAATVADDAVTASIHLSLAERDLLPSQHIADTGYVNSELFVSSQDEYEIDLIGPSRNDNGWQSKSGTGYAAADFTIDWDHKQATCPMGKTSVSWSPAIDRFKNRVIKIKFGVTDCAPCPSRSLCTRADPPRRAITVRPQAQHEALLEGRQRMHTQQFSKTYKTRAGVEGTIAQTTRSCGIRYARYIGEQRTHLQHLMTATA
ncbi:MAG: IS1182 family transposase, partial [Candidatus Omnitrophica bacterium]|nr:IS1182 family transposase [Candidatus Omnitrophota bacterium]